MSSNMYYQRFIAIVCYTLLTINCSTGTLKNGLPDGLHVSRHLSLLGRLLVAAIICLTTETSTMHSNFTVSYQLPDPEMDRRSKETRYSTVLFLEPCLQGS